MRFDCFYTDTIDKETLVTLVHPDYELKLGGSVVTLSQAKGYATYTDIVETTLKYSDLV